MTEPNDAARLAAVCKVLRWEPEKYRKNEPGEPIPIWPDIRRDPALAVKALEVLRHKPWIETVCYPNSWCCKMYGRPKTYSGLTLGAALFALIEGEMVEETP